MRKNQNRKGEGLLIGLIAVIVLGIVGVMLWSFLPQTPAAKPPVTTAAPSQSGTAAPTEQVSQTGSTQPQGQEPIDLGHGLKLTDAGKYTGLYMEDGSNEVLADVMMVIVQNSGEQDIQLAEITALSDTGEEYHFQLTNLPVGARVVLLDTDRKPSGGTVTSAALGNTALFDQPMDLCADTIRVTGMDGMVNVQNISGADIEGDIYVYYKYAAEDIFYGGITFRVRVEGGLKAGEIRQIPAGHYTTEGCTIVQVTIYD